MTKAAEDYCIKKYGAYTASIHDFIRCDVEAFNAGSKMWNKKMEFLLRDLEDIRDHSVEPFQGMLWTNYIHDVAKKALEAYRRLTDDSQEEK